MITTGWFLWIAVMFFFLLSPIGYGWGYRKWGPPYPQYIQRRRAMRAAQGGVTMFRHDSWGRGGDFVWIVLFIGVFWAAVAILWR